MKQEWYVYRDEQQEGPYIWEQLWELARSGALQPTDHVWTEGMGDWTLVGQVPGLAGIPASAVVPPPPPPLGAEARPASLPPARTVAQQAPPARKRTGRLIPALAAVVLVIGGCGTATILFLRDRGLLAFPAAVPVLSPTATVVSDLDETEEATQEAVIITEEPIREPTEQAIAETPTESADVDQGDEPRIEPTPEPTRQPTVQPTEDPTPETEAELPSPESPTETPDASDADQSARPSPTAVVDEFIRATLGTVPGAAVDDDRARSLMTVAYAAEFDAPGFVPLAYGIQEGPTSYEIASEELSDTSASVLALGYWGADLGRQWRFTLQEEAGLWRVAGIEVLDAAEPDDQAVPASPFWQLNPVVEVFTVYQNGGWELVVTFDPPAEDIGADFRIAYRRQDDGSLAYSQESSGVIEAGRVRLTLDSDWTGYDLSQLGFSPGKHRVSAIIDGAEIATGELIVE